MYSNELFFRSLKCSKSTNQTENKIHLKFSLLKGKRKNASC